MISERRNNDKMLKSNWNKYFTPKQLSQQLVDNIKNFCPTSIVDICAGSGNLLLAGQTRWPNAKLEGNDLYKDNNNSFALWYKEDGRRFALNKIKEQQYFDLVVGNPPFGYCLSNPFISNLFKSDCDDTDLLLRSPKMECSMTAASALLVSDCGVLAAIVPETLVFGESYQPLRKWLSKRFKRFEIKRVKRGDFCNKDLGLAFFTAYKKDFSEGCSPEEFIHAKSIIEQPIASNVEIVRGRLISSQISKRGGIPVLHCGGELSENGYTLRKCHNSIISKREHLWVQSGDIIVSRVGKAAGIAGVYTGQNPAVVSDCLYRFKFHDKHLYQLVRSLIESGEFNKNAHAISKGLGAQYITKCDLYNYIYKAIRNRQ